jgi:hypothetical protein
MDSARELVEILLYGMGSQRRFTQDSAIFPDVWLALMTAPDRPVAILLQPYQEIAPAEVARGLSEIGVGRRESGLVYNRALVAMNADLPTLVFKVTPLTAWYASAARPEHDAAGPAPTEDLARVATWLPEPNSLWDDLPDTPESGGPRGSTYPYRRLLAFIRAAGVIAYLRFRGITAELLMASLPAGEQARRDRLEEAALDGWRQGLDQVLPPPPPKLDANGAPNPHADGLIYSVNRDRPAGLAVAESRRTIKADAASIVFDISCAKLTWAVMDSGVDARHPAFRAPEYVGKPAPPDVVTALRESRVRETYDFSYFRELLLGPDAALPAHYRDPRYQAAIDEARQRADDHRPVDWELLRPILRMDPDQYVAPRDRHGTHVAGILGANWPNGPRGQMLGVCPDIQLLDIRVCKDDGTSSEFVVTAALQFLRHLNPTPERLAVHGINMSLSLEHDAANFGCGQTPVCQEAEACVAGRMVVVAAAGNLGYRRFQSDSEASFSQFCPVSVTDPGNAASVITVGATHRREPHTYGVSYFSSRGPTGDGRSKPDLVAPGEKIYAPAPDGDATTLDGTSMAAPHVSGAAALLMGRNFELIGQPAKIKALLCDHAMDLGRERYFQGSGLVDVLRAIQNV